MSSTNIDPVTFEVIRHKLWAIGDEQEITLKSVSGSPVVTESSDFNNGIYSSNGDIIMLGRQVIVHAGTMAAVLKSVIKECKNDPGIEDGDMFIMNDPYRGAVHAQDISIAAPIFYKGDLIAWFGACAHQLDVGGIEPGSWCPTAREQIQEGLIIPPLKLVERGKTRKDVLNMILSNSR
ncbi:MAG: hydantoinase B/oxoprolinase family protein, partial [Dehalococcoidia bacterium]|nr:hydantoinase B/oxoprolinase family protein [Dehalococcoidia bacterium]